MKEAMQRSPRPMSGLLNSFAKNLSTMDSGNPVGGGSASLISGDSLIFLCQTFDDLIPSFEQLTHVSFEKQPIRQSPDRA